ncbi:leukocyte cell-derived chemotaxin-2-like [Oreochromis niloticus]|uniref:leukocyte cell-derived chemotaxin-2-like n=1 Tax=Oreochromis niloticus TaxID=8128 RepID=UPI00025FACE0|nr:leukocyte cell-derived chemotaxin-2-like [Oreochromis niloticus]
MRRILVLLAVVWMCDTVKFGQLCSDNLCNTQRTKDNWGQGHYGASRGGRLHKGVDINCSDGSAVLAPFDVTIKGSLIVYNDPNKKAIDEGINLSGEGLCFKLFYVKPIKTSGTVNKGEKIGTMLPMQSVYPGITSHIHVQMCNRSVDPTEYFSDLCQTHVPSEETELTPGLIWWFDLTHNYYA